MANYYDGARAEEARRLHTVTTGPYSETVTSEPSPTLGEMLKLYELWSDGRIALLEAEQKDLEERIYSAFFGHFDAAEERARARVDGIVDAEVIDDDR